MRVLFVSLMGGVPWGGSEELWSRAALRLRASGHEVSASVYGWPQTPEAVQRLREAGIHVQERPLGRPSLLRRVGTRLIGRVTPDARILALREFIKRTNPELICVSSGVVADDLELLEICSRAGVTWCNLAQANMEWWWPTDRDTDRFIAVLESARCCFFVSEGNRRLIRSQLGVELSNSAIVHNPFNVPWHVEVAWPHETEPLRLACVARLDPLAKGQDILMQVMASEIWRQRPIAVSLFGNGAREKCLRRLQAKLGLEDRVCFRGHVKSIESIWAEHHALVLPSRHEGLPLALVEAMLCGRPAIVTDVAGNPEVVEDGVSGFVAAAPTVRHVHEALERAWSRRAEWRTMGLTAQERIRGLVPSDPVAMFCERLLELAPRR